MSKQHGCTRALFIAESSYAHTMDGTTVTTLYYGPDARYRLLLAAFAVSSSLPSGIGTPMSCLDFFEPLRRGQQRVRRSSPLHHVHILFFFYQAPVSCMRRQVHIVDFGPGLRFLYEAACDFTLGFSVDWLMVFRTKRQTD